MSECKHENWILTGDEPFGKVTCEDCGQLVWVSTVIQNMGERIKKYETQIKELLDKATKRGRPARSEK